MKYDHRLALLERLPQQGIGVEIGVHMGDFSSILLKHTDPKQLHLIDPWQYQQEDQYKAAWYGGLSEGQAEMDDRHKSVLRRFQSSIESGRIIIHRKPSEQALKTFSNNYFDWIYIDGNHLFEHVLEDLNNSYSKVKKGGYVCGDDYEEGGWWESGVLKAVDLFCKEKEVDIEIFGNQFLIKKI